jgi:hypothetical protein
MLTIIFKKIGSEGAFAQIPGIFRMQEPGIIGSNSLGG